MRELTYKEWLKQAIKKHQATYDKAYQNYQLTGENRYYTQYINAQNALTAYNSALDVEEKKDGKQEDVEREVKNILIKVQNTAELYKNNPKKAVTEILSDLKTFINFGI